LWHDLITNFGDDEWRVPLQTALHFCRSMQFTHSEDANLQGAILEKILPPSGSAAPPWYLRDIGTFFFVQAACLALESSCTLSHKDAKNSALLREKNLKNVAA
jgi:hypothetical protein